MKNCPFCKKELPTGMMTASEYARLFAAEQSTPTESAWRTPELIPLEDAVKAADADFEEKQADWRKLEWEATLLERKLGANPIAQQARNAADASWTLREEGAQKLQKTRAALHAAQTRFSHEYYAREYRAQMEEQQQKMQAKEAAKHQGLVDRVKGALTGGLKSRLVGA